MLVSWKFVVEVSSNHPLEDLLIWLHNCHNCTTIEIPWGQMCKMKHNIELFKKYWLITLGVLSIQPWFFLFWFFDSWYLIGLWVSAWIDSSRQPVTTRVDEHMIWFSPSLTPRSHQWILTWPAPTVPCTTLHSTPPSHHQPPLLPPPLLSSHKSSCRTHYHHRPTRIGWGRGGTGCAPGGEERWRSLSWINSRIT